jgi:hypothetical protein
MKNKHPYTATIETRTQLTFVRNLMRLDRLTSKESSKFYYGSRADTFKLNCDVVVVPLKKVQQGYIIYLASYVYGVGHFIYVTTKEFNKLNEFKFKHVKDVNIYQWRYLYYFEGILNEFEHPLNKLEGQKLQLEREISSNQYILENNKKKSEQLLARF